MSLQVLDAVQALAKEKGCAPSQLSLAWVAQWPGVTSPIVGPRSMAQLEDNLGATGVTLTDSDRKRLDEVAPPGRAIVPYYEADFGPHKFRWWKGRGEREQAVLVGGSRRGRQRAFAVGTPG